MVHEAQTNHTNGLWAIGKIKHKKVVCGQSLLIRWYNNRQCSNQIKVIDKMQAISVCYCCSWQTTKMIILLDQHIQIGWWNFKLYCFCWCTNDVATTWNMRKTTLGKPHSKIVTIWSCRNRKRDVCVCMCALVYLTFISNLVGLMHDNLVLKYCRYIFACKVVFHRGEIVRTNLVNIIQGDDTCDRHNLLTLLRKKLYWGKRYGVCGNL